jgi:hypothetical protein
MAEEISEQTQMAHFPFSALSSFLGFGLEYSMPRSQPNCRVQFPVRLM